MHTEFPRYSWILLRAGPLWLDGGSMFGIIPRVVWSKAISTDARGRIEVAHNCLLLSRADQPSGGKVLIEAGSGDKFDAKNRDIFGLVEGRSVEAAVRESGTNPADIEHAIVTHLHFDHVGGLTRHAGEGETDNATAAVRAFPNAAVHVQRREWTDALANNSVMTRTYLRENLEPLRDCLRLIESPPPFAPGYVPGRDERPPAPLENRLTEVLPGIFVFIVPGHTWGQQAVMFADDLGRTIVFTPDVMPTVHHVGAAYNMGYDVEPYVSMVTRRWFLKEAAERGWHLLLDHEPGEPLQRVEPDGRGWYGLIQES